MAVPKQVGHAAAFEGPPVRRTPSSRPPRPEHLGPSEAHMLHAQRLETLGRLASEVIHDFNNILTVILTASTELHQRVQDDPDIAEDVVAITEAAQRADALTRQLLLFSRGGAAKPHVMDLNRAVSGLTGLCERVLGPDIRLRRRLSQAAQWVDVDAAQLGQVILNLVVNARDAMPHGGELLLSVSELSEQPGFCCLSVRDTGSGMDPSVRAQLFEPFYTTKEPGAGTGLGLSSVRAIVHHWGGWVDVDTRVGEGSTFVVHMPKALKPPEEPSDG